VRKEFIILYTKARDPMSKGESGKDKHGLVWGYACRKAGAALKLMASQNIINAPRAGRPDRTFGDPIKRWKINEKQGRI